MATQGSLGTLSVNIDANMRGFNNGMNQLQGRMGNIASKMKSVGSAMTKFVTLPILAIGAASVKSAMDLEASEAKYTTVFEGMTEQADSFIKKFQELSPATTAEARNMASGIQDLLVPLGFVREEATNMTGAFMNVTGALANFNSGTHTAEQVAGAMQSAITGEYDSLKGLGIQLDVNTVKQKAVAMGLAESTKEVTKQDQAQVLLREVYKQSTDALNAYTKENLDSKTKLALLNKSLQDMAASFGVLLLPLINKATTFVKKLTDKFAKMTPTAKKVTVIIAGILAVVGPLILAIGTLIPLIATFGATISAAIWPVTLIVAAIGALIAAGWLLYKNWEDIVDNLSIVFLGLQRMALGVFGKIVDFAIDMAKKVIDKVDLIGSFLTKIFPDIGKSLTTLKNKFDKFDKDFTTAQVQEELRLTNKITEHSISIQERKIKKQAEAEKKESELSKTIGNSTDAYEVNTDALLENIDAVDNLGDSYDDTREKIVDAVDDLGTGVTDALRNQYDEWLAMEEKSINRSIRLVEKESDEKIDQYNSVFMAKLKTLDAETRASIMAVENQIKGINSLTDTEEKELDKQSFMKEKAERIKAIAEEDSVDRRAKLQEDYNDFVAKRERKLLLEQRKDKVENLRNEIDKIRDNAQKKQQILQEEFNAQKANEEAIARQKLNFLNTNLSEVRGYHAEYIKEENINANARELIIKGNQEDILKLIKTYNPKWQEAGKTLGEKLLDGLSESENKIKSKLSSIMSQINSVISRASSIGSFSTPAISMGSSSLMNTISSSSVAVPKTSSGVTVNVTGNTISGQREADKLATSIVSRMRMAGVNP